jgi:VIT1/CCC1 family predicted Fe2+/Mn2+ transporter
MAKENDLWRIRLKEWTELDKPSRISEILFGLIMVLTFTGTISASTAGKQEVRELLWAALGCNIAWGLVDGIMYLMDVLVGRAYNVMQLNRIKRSESKVESREIIRDNLSPLLADLMDNEDIDRLDEKLKKLPELSVRKTFILKDFLIAGQIFILVFLVTFPVALPFLFIDNVALAMRISNGVALLLLFAGGFTLARYSGLRPVITALAYTAIGVFLVALTMSLGG